MCLSSNVVKLVKGRFRFSDNPPGFFFFFLFSNWHKSNQVFLKFRESEVRNAEMRKQLPHFRMNKVHLSGPQVSVVSNQLAKVLVPFLSLICWRYVVCRHDGPTGWTIAGCFSLVMMHDNVIGWGWWMHPEWMREARFMQPALLHQHRPRKVTHLLIRSQRRIYSPPAPIRSWEQPDICQHLSQICPSSLYASPPPTAALK